MSYVILVLINTHVCIYVVTQLLNLQIDTKTITEIKFKWIKRFFLEVSCSLLNLNSPLASVASADWFGFSCRMVPFHFILEWSNKDWLGGGTLILLSYQLHILLEVPYLVFKIFKYSICFAFVDHERERNIPSSYIPVSTSSNMIAIFQPFYYTFSSTAFVSMK
jgi:hypothetical protein